MTLTAAHRVRVGEGLDAVRLEARGFGLLIGTFGLRWVSGSLDVLVWRRFGARRRCRALFLGLHGLAWSSVQLAPIGRAAVPEARPPQLPALPAAPRFPDLAVRLTVTPPDVP